MVLFTGSIFTSFYTCSSAAKEIGAAICAESSHHGFSDRFEVDAFGCRPCSRVCRGHSTATTGKEPAKPLSRLSPHHLTFSINDKSLSSLWKVIPATEVEKLPPPARQRTRIAAIKCNSHRAKASSYLALHLPLSLSGLKQPRMSSPGEENSGFR